MFYLWDDEIDAFSRNNHEMKKKIYIYISYIKLIMFDYQIEDDS